MRIQSITNITDNKLNVQKPKNGVNTVSPSFKAGKDAFVKSKKVLCTMKDIRNYLEQNKGKIENGKIFNEPLGDGDSLLMQFIHITPNDSEMSDYKSILFDMLKMEKINYDQKDSFKISALEWIMGREEPMILSLIKDKELTKDPKLEYTYKQIKNPEFRNELITLDIYRPHVYATEEEQNVLIDSILSQNNFEADTSLKQEIIKSMQNKNGHISNDISAVLRQVIKSCSNGDLANLSEFMNKIKNETGNVNLEEISSVLAKKETDKLTLREVINQMNMDEEAKAYMETAKKYLDSKGIEWIQDKDGLLIISHFTPGKEDKNIDYNKLFKCIKAVIGFCNFAQVDITDYGNLQYICGGTCLSYTANTLGKIESIGIDIDFGYPKFQKRHKMEHNLKYSSIQSFDMKSTGPLKRVGGHGSFEYAFELEEVPNLEYVEELVLNTIIGPEENVFKDVEIGKLVILGR